MEIPTSRLRSILGLYLLAITAITLLTLFNAFNLKLNQFAAAASIFAYLWRQSWITYDLITSLKNTNISYLKWDPIGHYYEAWDSIISLLLIAFACICIFGQ